MGTAEENRGGSLAALDAMYTASPPNASSPSSSAARAANLGTAMPNLARKRKSPTSTKRSSSNSSNNSSNSGHSHGRHGVGVKPRAKAPAGARHPYPQTAPPPPQPPVASSLAKIMHRLQAEWHRYECDRDEWAIERGLLQRSNTALKAENKALQLTVESLSSQLTALEAAVRELRGLPAAPSSTPAGLVMEPTEGASESKENEWEEPVEQKLYKQLEIITAILGPERTSAARAAVLAMNIKRQNPTFQDSCDQTTPMKCVKSTSPEAFYGSDKITQTSPNKCKHAQTNNILHPNAALSPNSSSKCDKSTQKNKPNHYHHHRHQQHAKSSSSSFDLNECKANLDLTLFCDVFDWHDKLESPVSSPKTMPKDVVLTNNGEGTSTKYWLPHNRMVCGKAAVRSMASFKLNDGTQMIAVPFDDHTIRLFDMEVILKPSSNVSVIPRGILRGAKEEVTSLSYDYSNRVLLATTAKKTTNIICYWQIPPKLPFSESDNPNNSVAVFDKMQKLYSPAYAHGLSSFGGTTIAPTADSLCVWRFTSENDEVRGSEACTVEFNVPNQGRNVSLLSSAALLSSQAAVVGFQGGHRIALVDITTGRCVAGYPLGDLFGAHQEGTVYASAVCTSEPDFYSGLVFAYSSSSTKVLGLDLRVPPTKCCFAKIQTQLANVSTICAYENPATKTPYVVAGDSTGMIETWDSAQCAMLDRQMDRRTNPKYGGTTAITLPLKMTSLVVGSGRGTLTAYLNTQSH